MKYEVCGYFCPCLCCCHLLPAWIPTTPIIFSQGHALGACIILSKIRVHLNPQNVTLLRIRALAAVTS